MEIRRLGGIVLVFCVVSIAKGQTTTYRPFESWTDPAVDAYARWDGDVRTRMDHARPVRPETRPQLAGLRPKSVELLEDGLLRKHPRLLGNSPSNVKDLVLRRVAKGKVPQLRGYMAEAIFLDRNPEWGYVGKPNATQHDVYRWVNGRRTPLNGQVKFHASGKPSIYAGDMYKDHRAHRFLIPDDHVKPTKAYLKRQAFRLEAAGDKLGAARRWRDYNRVDPIGATSAEIHNATREAVRSLARERYATYTSLGATILLSFGPTIYDWARGDLPGNTAPYRIVRSLSLMGVGVGADVALRHIGRGALRGTLRGNVIIGIGVSISDTAWLLHEHGWSRSFYQPEFYEQIGGSVGALALGLAGGTLATGLAAATGPWAPVIGFGAGMLTSAVGYFGGKTVAGALLEMLSPEMLRREERQRLTSVKSSLAHDIAVLQVIPNQ